MSTPLGDLIRHKRKDKGWTQTQLAERLRVQQVTVSEWETGKNQPRDITAVMKILGITHDEFMAAVAAMVYDDPVVIHLSATTAVSAEVRDALLTLYREAVQAHRTKNDKE
jgi:transcriptional regulator with XRE-family HTH domain